MENWIAPEVEEISFTATEQGSKTITVTDHTWQDDEKGWIGTCGPS